MDNRQFFLIHTSRYNKVLSELKNVTAKIKYFIEPLRPLTLCNGREVVRDTYDYDHEYRIIHEDNSWSTFHHSGLSVLAPTQSAIDKLITMRPDYRTKQKYGMLPEQMFSNPRVFEYIEE